MSESTAVTILKALADNTRLDIVRQLACESEGKPCQSVSRQLSLSQPTISHHVSKLVDAGIVLEHRAGKEKVYALDKKLLSTHGIDPAKL